MKNDNGMDGNKICDGDDNGNDSSVNNNDGIGGRYYTSSNKLIS